MDKSQKIGSQEYDGLIADINPAVQVGAVTIRKEGSEETTYKRGTIFAKSSIDGLLVILGTEAAEAVEGVEADVEHGVEAVEAVPAEVLTPYAILADDVTVGTDEDVTVAAYTAGCFNSGAIVVADDYDITEADKDALRAFNIILKAASAAE